MSRPEELSRQQDEAAQKNDEKIIAALKQLELGKVCKTRPQCVDLEG